MTRAWIAPSRHRTGAVVFALVVLAAACSSTGSPEATVTAVTVPTDRAVAPTTTSGVPDGAVALALDPSRPLPRPPIGLKIDWPRRDAYASFYDDLPGAPAFYHLTWCDIESQPGRRDWARPDDWVSWHRERGADLAVKITIGSCWATGGRTAEPRGALRRTPSALPVDLDAYATFVTEVVERFRPQGVTAFAVENEIDAPNFWTGDLDGYLDVARTAAGAIRAAAPDAVVVDPGLTSVGHGTVLVERIRRLDGDAAAIELYRRFFARRIGTSSRYPDVRTAADLDDYLTQPVIGQQLRAHDAVATLHAEGVFDVVQLHHYEGATTLHDTVGLVRSELPGKPIEAWELGLFGTAGGEGAAMTEAFATIRAALDLGIDRIIWLPGAAEPGDEDRWGALSPELAPRPLLDLARALGLAAGPGARWGSLAEGSGSALDGPTSDVVMPGPDAGLDLVTHRADGWTLIVPDPVRTPATVAGTIVTVSEPNVVAAREIFVNEIS